MKRTALARRTSLTAKTPLKRTTALTSSPLSASSKHRNSAGNQRQKRVTAKDTGPSEATVKLVGERDGWCCVRCGAACRGQRGVDWSVQHRRARGMGGSRRPDTNQPQNLILLCGSATTGCHGYVEAEREIARGCGWAIGQSENPLLIAVAHAKYGPVRLDAFGGYAQCEEAS